MILTKDLRRARTFYEETLGLKGREQAGGAVPFDCGGGSGFLLYQTLIDIVPGPTVASWTVTDMWSEVAGLQSSGVEFLEPDYPGTTKEGVVYSLTGVGKGAWFQDPDGNVLQLFEPHRS